MPTKEEALEKIKSLIERFNEQKESYKKADYNETQTRRDFIDPFWKALGWDVDNENNYAENYREVIHEARVKIDGKTKAPDYLFRLTGGKNLFFLEAKKPSIDIKTNIKSAYQIRRYGWTAKTPISIISDFEEFAVYDCTKKPKETDSASTARIKYITYSDYIKEFDFIWDTFSRECVPQGNFDKYIQSDKNKKGTTTVDQDFLISLDKWREKLASDIANSNRKKEITEDELTFVVQNTLNRIIFLRIAEDRGAEKYEDLQNAMKSGNYYQNLLQLFYNADNKYNSGLFDFSKDQISTKIAISNGTLKSIIHELYYPICPYEFSVMSVEILGSAYEQFLGKQIKLSKALKAIIEEKPKVRKAGGVYYTPQYIVDYIVKNTVGKLVPPPNPLKEGEISPAGGGRGWITPEDVSKIKICDPACGSGNFLIGAYQYLLNWHKDYYLNADMRQSDMRYATIGNRQSDNRITVLTPQGELTSAEKKRILVNNIYGVDLDSNAVEVAKLSLLLKCIEGETLETIEAHSKVYNERLLPSLENNIKTGNSLVDLDYFETDYEIGDEEKIKPFSWEKNFPEVYRTRNRGFDVVIGNPPYVKVADKNLIDYFSKKYEHQDYQQDLYLLFLERYEKLLAKSGKLGVIIPNTWLQSIKFKNIRRYLMNNFLWERILHINQHIFKAVVDTHVLIFERNNYIKSGEVAIDMYDKDEIALHQYISQLKLPDNGDVINVLASEDEKVLFEKIKNASIPISEICEVYNGVKPFCKGRGTPIQTDTIMNEKPYVKTGEKPEGENWLPLLRGSLMNRYINLWNNNYWIKYGICLAEPRNPKIFEAEEKIIVRQTGDSIIATIIDKDIICRDNLHLILSEKINLQFILGLLNSKLLDFYYNQINPERGEALAQVKKQHVEQLPVPKTVSEKQQATIIKHVDQLLQLHKDLQTATLPNQIEQIKQRIAYTEGRIDEVVYGLYGLTEEEREMIEK